MTLLEFINQRTALLDQRLALQANAQQQAEQVLALQLLTGLGPYRHAAAGTAQNARAPSTFHAPTSHAPL